MRIHQGRAMGVDSLEESKIPVDVVGPDVVARHSVVVAVQSEMNADHYPITITTSTPPLFDVSIK